MNLHRLISGIFCLWLMNQMVWAANIVVNTVNDNSIAADGLCTLREAISNSNAGSDSTSGDCVAGTSDNVISFSVTGSVVLNSSLPEITRILTITGVTSDPTAIEISGGTDNALIVGNASGVSGKLTLKSLSRVGGSAIQGGGLLVNASSSAILENVIFKNNSASEGGAIYLDSNASLVLQSNCILTGNSSSYMGGAIYNNDGIVTITNSTLSQNSAFSKGGAIYSNVSIARSLTTMNISNSLIIDNKATDSLGSYGGAIAFDGSTTGTSAGLNLDSVRFYANTATTGGGALYLSYTGNVSIQNSFIGEAGQGKNTAQNGGGIYNESSILTLINMQLVNNQGISQGGALFNASSASTNISSSQFLSNFAANGAAIFNAGKLTLSDTTLGSSAQPNIANEHGGAVYSSSATSVDTSSSRFLFNQSRDGAAFYVADSASNILLNKNNCFVGNISSSGYAVSSLGSIIDASNAWWGAVSGATSPTNAGLGDSAGDFVTVTPALTTPPAGCSAANYTMNPAFNSTIAMGSVAVGSSITTNIQITETGDIDLKFDNPVFSGANTRDFSISSPTAFPLILANGDAPKIVTVQCTPSALGTRTATLKIPNNSVTNDVLTVNLSCTGSNTAPIPAAIYQSTPLPNASISLLQSELNTPSISNILVVSNTGTAALQYSFGTPTTTSGQHIFNIPQGRFEVPIAASQLHLISCTPTHLGVDTITLPVTTNDPNLTTLGYTISCEGVNKVTNQAPSDITLSNAGIAENSVPNIVVGTFTTTDADAADSHTYSLLNSNNGLFSLIGNQLMVTQTLDYEVANTYKITVQTTDSKGASFSKDFNIVVLDINEQVFSIRGEIRANNAAAATMTLDNPQTFSLVTIIQPDTTQLTKKADVNVVFRFTAANSTTPLTVPMTLSQITLTNPTNISLFAGRLIGLTGVLTADVSYTVEGNSFSAANILRLTLNENRAPTAISLSNNTIKENSANGAVVGTLQVSDLDNSEIINCGFNGANSKNPFAIRNNSLVVAHGDWLDYETTTQYPLTIRCIDSVGHAIQQAFVINVENVANEAATRAFYLTRNIIQENSPENTIIGKFETIKKGTGNYQYSLLNDADGRFKLKDNMLQVADSTLLDFEQAQSYNIEVQQTIGSEKISQTFEIQLTNETDAGLNGSVFEQNTTNSPNATLADPSNLLNTKNFDVTMTFTPDVDDVGKTAELFMLAVVAPTNSRFFAAFILTPTGWQEWTGQLNSLQAIGAGVLESTHTFTLNTGTLPEFNGKIAFFVGYRIGTGNLVYNLTPFSLVFHP